MGAKINAKNPATINPGTNREANQKHKPLTTKENAPKVKIVAGKERIEIMGLTPILTIPMIKAAAIAAGKLAKSTPGKIISTTNKLRAVASIVNSFPNIFFSLENVAFKVSL